MHKDKGGDVVDLVSKGQGLYSISWLARQFCLDRETVRKRLADVEPSGRQNGYKVWSIRAAALHLVGSVVAPGTDFDPETLPPESRDKWFASELKRLQLAREQGDLIPLEEVREEWAAVMKTIVAHLEAIPDLLEAEFQLTPGQVDDLERVIDEIRLSIHTDLVDDDE